jgi:hypothetical protein
MLRLSQAGQRLLIRRMREIANEPTEYLSTKTDKTSHVHLASQQRIDIMTEDPANFTGLHRWS